MVGKVESILSHHGSKSTVEKTAQVIFTVCGFFAVLAVASITLYMLVSGTPAIFKVGLTEILFGNVWQPAAKDPSFGIHARDMMFPDGVRQIVANLFFRGKRNFPMESAACLPDRRSKLRVFREPVGAGIGDFPVSAFQEDFRPFPAGVLVVVMDAVALEQRENALFRGISGIRQNERKGIFPQNLFDHGGGGTPVELPDETVHSMEQCFAGKESGSSRLNELCMKAGLFQLPEKNAQFFLKIQKGRFSAVADDQPYFMHPLGIGVDEDPFIAVPVDGTFDAEAFDCFSVSGQAYSEPFAHFAARGQSAAETVFCGDQGPQLPQDLHIGFVFVMAFFFHTV